MEALQFDLWATALWRAAQSDPHDDLVPGVYELLGVHSEVIEVVGEVGDQAPDALMSLDPVRIRELSALLCHDVLAKEGQQGIDASAVKRLVRLPYSLHVLLRHLPPSMSLGLGSGNGERRAQPAGCSRAVSGARSLREPDLIVGRRCGNIRASRILEEERSSK